MWGIVDLLSSVVGLLGLKGAAASGMATIDNPLSPDKTDQGMDVFYQSKMIYDRLWDSLARIIVAGAIFTYSRLTVNKLEK